MHSWILYTALSVFSIHVTDKSYGRIIVEEIFFESQNVTFYVWLVLLYWHTIEVISFQLQLTEKFQVCFTFPLSVQYVDINVCMGKILSYNSWPLVSGNMLHLMHCINLTHILSSIAFNNYFTPLTTPSRKLSKVNYDSYFLRLLRLLINMKSP